MQINWEALGAIGEIGGVIVVIATLVYLARQIRQSNQIALASTEITVRDNLNAVNDIIYSETGVAELLIKASDSHADLSDVESLKLNHLILRGLNQWLSIETAFDNRMVTPATHNMIYEDMRGFLAAHPAIRPICRQAIDNYPAMARSKVFEHMNQLLAEYGL